MSKISYGEVIATWQALLAAAQDNTTAAGDLDPVFTDLQQQLEKIKRIKARQDSATATRQACTQELHEGIAEGNTLAMRLRSLARVKLGPYNERLVQFGVAPVRTRRPRHQRILEIPTAAKASVATPEEGESRAAE